MEVEGGQFGNRLGRLEYEIPRRVPLPDRVVDREKQLEIVEAGEFVGVGHGQPRADRAEAAIALAFEELHLRQLHVAGAEVVRDGDGEDIVLDLSAPHVPYVCRAIAHRGLIPTGVVFACIGSRY